MPKMRSAVLLSTCVGLLAACGDNGTGPGDDDRVEKADPSFAADIVEITNRRGCTMSGCHGSGAGGMTLGDAATTYAAWVDVPSAGAPTEIRVIPGDAQNSYVVKKVEGRASVGARMPFGLAPLDAIDLANLRNWIDQGAKNN